MASAGEKREQHGPSRVVAVRVEERDRLPGPEGQPTGDDRHVMDYLMDEVLSRQPDQVQQFLLQTF